MILDLRLYSVKILSVCAAPRDAPWNHQAVCISCAHRKVTSVNNKFCYVLDGKIRQWHAHGILLLRSRSTVSIKM